MIAENPSQSHILAITKTVVYENLEFRLIFTPNVANPEASTMGFGLLDFCELQQDLTALSCALKRINASYDWLRAGMFCEYYGYFPSSVNAVQLAQINRSYKLFSRDCFIAACDKLAGELDLFAQPAKMVMSGFSQGYVYLAACDTGHYKIGRSKTPNERIRHFDTQMPVAVSVAHMISCDNAKWAEAELHRIYAEKRFRGEWFSLNEMEVYEITRLKSFESGFFFGQVERAYSPAVAS